MSKEYNVGDIVSGVVTGVEDYGIFLSFGKGCSGLIHISEVSDYYVKNIHDYAKIDDVITAKILECDSNQHFKLSIKSLHSHPKNDIDCPNGFTRLSSMLTTWIHDSYDEITKKN